ncbi:periplasmic protein-like protein [Hyphomicrobium denitrificans 1NES1]|uniref:Periplasmic protein-like protein n=2 Tax=Hyphomicrobium denitrificans TaxID=53399 RepID=N0B7F0_9HYPH|nr:periplasmic protein-like protein [Hyphomicrobium denitrificans 1NES1]
MEDTNERRQTDCIDFTGGKECHGLSVLCIQCEVEMKLISLFSKIHLIQFLSLLLLSAPWTAPCLAENGIPKATDQAVEDDTRKAFTHLDDYLKNNAIKFTTSYDAQSISLGTSRGAARFYVERPNLLRLELSGDGFSYLMISDGKVFTIYDEKKKKYAQRPATERPIEAVNLFTGLAAFQARVPQFFGLVGDVANGNIELKVTKVGVDRVGGLACVRYDMQYVSQADSDKWTVWLRADGVPLPCKTFIESSDEGSKQTNLYNWENKAPQSEKYVFVPPSGSTEVGISELSLRPLQ